MPRWTHGEIAALREARRRCSMDSLMRLFPTHDRDEIVTAIDCVVREPRDADAVERASQIMIYQMQGVPLVNGKPVEAVERGRDDYRRVPMF